MSGFPTSPANGSPPDCDAKIRSSRSPGKPNIRNSATPYRKLRPLPQPCKFYNTAGKMSRYGNDLAAKFSLSCQTVIPKEIAASRNVRPWNFKGRKFFAPVFSGSGRRSSQLNRPESSLRRSDGKCGPTRRARNSRREWQPL